MVALAIVPVAAFSSFFLTPQTAVQLSGCIRLCAEFGQQPACISSSAEHDSAVAALGSTTEAFVGNVLSPTGGTAICPAGTVTYFQPSWAAGIGRFGQPDDLRWAGGEVGVLQGCALLSTVGWEDVPCRKYGRSAPCMCANGNATATIYQATINAHVAEEEAAAMEDGGAQGVAWGVAIAIWLSVEWLVRILFIGRLHVKGAQHQGIAWAKRNVQHTAPTEDVESADAGAPESTEQDDEIALRAAATLDAAKEAAVRVRKAVGMVATITLTLAILVLLPVFFLCLAMEWPIALPGIPFIFAVTAAAATGQDPTEPRRVRFQLGAQAITMMPLLGGWFCAATFGYLPLTPSLGMFCSTRDPRCKAMAHIAMPLIGMFVLIFWYNGIRLLPVLYASRERAYPHPKVLHAEQKKLIAEAKGSHNCMYRNDPAYLLEGVNYFDMPLKVALDRWYATMRIFGFLIGVAWAAIGVFLYYGPMPRRAPADGHRDGDRIPRRPLAASTPRNRSMAWASRLRRGGAQGCGSRRVHGRNWCGEGPRAWQEELRRPPVEVVYGGRPLEHRSCSEDWLAQPDDWAALGSVRRLPLSFMARRARAEMGEARRMGGRLRGGGEALAHPLAG